MSTTMAPPAPVTAEDYEAAFYRLMAEAESLNEQMRSDRREIERLKAETKAIREDTGRLKAETRSLLESIGAKV